MQPPFASFISESKYLNKKKTPNFIKFIQLTVQAALAIINREVTSGSQRHWSYVCTLKDGYELSGF